MVDGDYHRMLESLNDTAMCRITRVLSS